MKKGSCPDEWNTIQGSNVKGYIWTQLYLLDTRVPHTNKRPMRTDFMYSTAQLLPKLDNFPYILAFFLSSVLFSCQGRKQQNTRNAQMSAEANNSIFLNSNKQGLLAVELFSHLRGWTDYVMFSLIFSMIPKNLILVEQSYRFGDRIIPWATAE